MAEPSQIRRMKNKEFARQTRKRKKNYIDGLEGKIILLEAEIDALQKENSILKSKDKIYSATNMEEAVKWAYYLGKEGDQVLLSPACPGFDRFENYEDRGDQFKQAVRNL